MRASPLRKLMYLFLISHTSESLGYREYDIGKFVKSITNVFPVGINRQIKIVIPEQGCGNSSTEAKYSSHSYARNVQTFTPLYSNFYASVNMLKNVTWNNQNESTLTIVVDVLDATKICELAITANLNPYNYYLIYVPNFGSPTESLHECEINYNTNFYIYYLEKHLSLICIEEVYRISKTSYLEHNLLAKYDPMKDIVSYFSSSVKWARRDNLKGTKFDAFAMPFEPYVIQKKNASIKNVRGNENEFSGMMIDVIEVLGDRLNFTVTKCLPPKYDYNEVVKMVSNRSKDMILGMVAMTYDRSLLVDFSLAIKEEKSGLFYPKIEDQILYHGYTRPFYSDSWFAVIAQILISSLVVCWLSLFSNDFAKSGVFSATALKALIFSILSTLAKRFPIEPKSFACRIAFITVSLTGFVIISLYRAMLGASLAITIHHPPINSMKDVLESEYKIGTLSGTNLEKYFTESEKNSYLFEIGKKKLVLDKPDSSSLENDPMRNMYLNLVKHHKHVLIFGHDIDYPSYHKELSCRFSTIEEIYTVIGAGYIFQKHWTYTKLINHYILKLMEDGTIEHLKRKWHPRRIRCEVDPIQPSNLHDIYSLCVTLVMGFLMSIILLFVEVSYST